MPTYIYYPDGGFEITYGQFFVEPEGGFCSTGSTNCEVLNFYHSQFQERDICYVRAKAEAGILEAVAIKRVEFVNGSFTYGQFVPLYIDTYNSYWTDELLVDQTTGIQLTQQYYADAAAYAYQQRKLKNPCLP